MIKRVFVSDVHMSTGWSLSDPQRRYDWLDADEADNFAQFLANLNDDSSVQEVILLGDIMDDWVYPIDKQPPRYDEIVQATHIRAVLNNLKALAQNRNKHVVYVVGNHDITLMTDRFRQLRDKFFRDISFQESYETPDGIFAEHGHQYVMWNAADPSNILPEGHYISRLAATVEARKNERCRQAQVIARLFTSEKFTMNTRVRIEDPMINLPLSYLANKLGIDDSEPIVTADGASITLGDVRAMYVDLSARWEASHGTLDVLRSAVREAIGLAGVADQIATERDKAVIIFGHTHTKENRYLGQPDAVTGEIEDPYAVYANCGSWCNHNDPSPRPYTYVVTEYDEGNGKHTVSLMYWGEEREPEVNII